jgi:hypothetical protein
VQEQLALVQGPAQVGLQLDPGHQLGVHLGVVAGEAALAGRLGPVHGQVGVAQQLVGAVDVAVHAGDAHAAPHVQLAAVDHERLAQPSRTRSATWVTSMSSLASSMSTANSSPPKRATVSGRPSRWASL